MFFEIIELDKSTEAMRNPLKEAEGRKSNVENELEDRKKTLADLEKKTNETQSEIERLTEMMKSLDERALQTEKGLSGELNAVKISSNLKKDEFRKAIRVKIRKVCGMIFYYNRIVLL